MNFLLVPGTWVRLATRPDWGSGQVQSAIGNRVTVNFDEAGKQVINTEIVALDLIDDGPGPPRTR